MESIDEIIEEMRATTKPACPGINVDVCHKYSSCEEHRDALIDAIEAELAEMKDFIDRLHEAADKREDVTLFDVDYKACPLDAEGRMFRIGDLAQSVRFPTFKPKKVCGFGTINGKSVVFYVSESGDGHSSEVHNGWDYADSVRRYREPTVKDVLCELLDEVGVDGVYSKNVLLRKYAEKLKEAMVQ